ncbi:TPA: transcriptional regulator [Streptococcus suis]|nr:transcriptional regulator [Streptococcus suis]HEL2079880.1 transcriptional regulator [Streptococcus suis]
MLITLSLAEKVRIKRARLQLTKKAASEQLGIQSNTLTKVENGNYDAPKSIYESVMTWLVEEI